MDLMTKLRSQWDRTLAVVAGLTGAAVLVIGWFGVSGSAYPAEQLPYIISGGIGGLFLLGVSTALWLSADLHDEWRKLDRIEQAIREAGAAADAADEAAYARGFEPADDDDQQTRRLPQLAAGTGT